MIDIEKKYVCFNCEDVVVHDGRQWIHEKTKKSACKVTNSFEKEMRYGACPSNFEVVDSKTN